jgi:hypothetical protein
VFKICPAYPESGSTCYTVTGVKCGEGEIEFASLDEQVAYCGKCDFYAHQRSGSKYSIASMTKIEHNCSCKNREKPRLLKRRKKYLPLMT